MNEDQRARPRVLLADDNQSVLTLISQILGENFDVVGAVLNGAAAIEAVNELKPDVLVLDVIMPVLDGIDAAKRVRKAGAVTKIVFLTSLEDPIHIDAVLKANADGVVFKSRLTDDLARAIKAALAGDIFVSPRDPI